MDLFFSIWFISSIHFDVKDELISFGDPSHLKTLLHNGLLLLSIYSPPVKEYAILWW